MEWTGQVPAWAVLGLSAVAAIAYGAHRYRPKAPLAWWFMGAGVLLFITGDTIYKSWHQIMGQNNIPFPSFVDAIYITMYPVLAVGLLLLARSRVPGGDHASLLDGLIITVGVGLLSWIFLIGPNVRAPGGLLVRFTAAAYPLGDILLLAMLAHLWSAGGLRNTAGRLLAIGTLGTLVADSVYGLAGLHTGWNWHDGNPFDLGWILFYSCWGAAALHPSMRELSEAGAAGPAQDQPGTAHLARSGLPHCPRCPPHREPGRKAGRRRRGGRRGRGHVPSCGLAHVRPGPRTPASRDPGTGLAPGGGRIGRGARAQRDPRSHHQRRKRTDRDPGPPLLHWPGHGPRTRRLFHRRRVGHLQQRPVSRPGRAATGAPKRAWPPARPSAVGLPSRSRAPRATARPRSCSSARSSRRKS